MIPNKGLIVVDSTEFCPEPTSQRVVIHNVPFMKLQDNRLGRNAASVEPQTPIFVDLLHLIV